MPDARNVRLSVQTPAPPFAPNLGIEWMLRSALVTLAMEQAREIHTPEPGTTATRGADDVLIERLTLDGGALPDIFFGSRRSHPAWLTTG